MRYIAITLVLLCAIASPAMAGNQDGRSRFTMDKYYRVQDPVAASKEMLKEATAAGIDLELKGSLTEPIAIRVPSGSFIDITSMNLEIAGSRVGD